MEQPVRRVVIAAHFDRDGILDPHVRATLASLAGPETRILLVSTNLAEGECLAGTGISTVIRRENRGYDFHSWQVGIKALGDAAGFDELILLNDSFYLAREQALVAALAAMGRRRCDVWGLTASREHRPHLQSCFLAFRPRAVRSAWFKRFWDGVAPDSGREEAIIRYELPLAAEARAAGLRVAALLPAPRLPLPALLARRWSIRRREAGRRAAARAVLDALRGEPAENPMLQRWRRTVRRCGVVKVALLRAPPPTVDPAPVWTHMEPACMARARQHLARLGVSPLAEHLS